MGEIRQWQDPAPNGRWVDTLAVHRSALNDRVWVPLAAGPEPTGLDASVALHAGTLAEVRAWACAQVVVAPQRMRWRTVTGVEGRRNLFVLQVHVTDTDACAEGEPVRAAGPASDPHTGDLVVAALPSPAQIDAARSPAGGWARAALDQWGVPWPPPKGWRADLIRRWSAEQAPTPTPAQGRTEAGGTLA